MSLVKGRQCSESCLELLALELVRAYGRQSRVPPAAAVDAIGTASCKQRCWPLYAPDKMLGAVSAAISALLLKCLSAQAKLLG